MTVSSTAMRYNPFAPDFYTADPFAVYRWMWDEAPAYRSEQWGELRSRSSLRYLGAP